MKYVSEIVSITNSAKSYLIKAMNNNGKNNVMLAIDSGGCNGFQYSWDFVDTLPEGDDVTCLGHTTRGSNDKIDLNLVIDKSSELFLLGSEIDYISDLGGSYLKINNPMAKSQCGCGTSFSA